MLVDFVNATSWCNYLVCAVLIATLGSWPSAAFYVRSGAPRLKGVWLEYLSLFALLWNSFLRHEWAAPVCFILLPWHRAKVASAPKVIPPPLLVCTKIHFWYHLSQSASTTVLSTVASYLLIIVSRECVSSCVRTGHATRELWRMKKNQFYGLRVSYYWTMEIDCDCLCIFDAGNLWTHHCNNRHSSIHCTVHAIAWAKWATVVVAIVEEQSFVSIRHYLPEADIFPGTPEKFRKASWRMISRTPPLVSSLK